MERQTSFSHQRQVLEQFLSVLSAFETEFKELVQKYEQGISNLYEEQGLMEEIYQDYNSAYLQPMKSSLFELISRVQEEDIPFVEKEIDFIASR